MQTVHEALLAMDPHFAPLPSEQLPLADACGRCLDRAVSASHDTPAFDNSAMDGYALRFGAELSAGTRLPVVGEAAAGQAPGRLHEGSAMRIFTGAPIPAGADTVVIQEHVEPVAAAPAEQATIELRTPPARRGQHVRARGGDVERGAELLPAGTVLRPGEIALLASQGHANVTAHRRPRVAIVNTGDELREPGQPLPAGALYNSNGPALAALVTEAGGVPWVLRTASDDPADIASRIGEALAADLVVTTGGVSVGDHDRVVEALSSQGVQQVLWKVAIKPGKPLWFGVAEQVPVFGLPGNPVSAMLTFEVFVRPALRRMLGHPRPHRRAHRITLAHPHRHSVGRDELARGRLVGRGPDGLWCVSLHEQQGSGSLRSMCDVDVLVWLPARIGEFSAGAHLDALLLPNASYQTGHNAPDSAAPTTPGD